MTIIYFISLIKAMRYLINQRISQLLCHLEYEGMLALELSSYVLEIPCDAHTTLSQILIGCSTLIQEYCKLIG